MNVSDIMTENPLTLPATASLAQARDLMISNKIRHIPVVENQQIVGVVSQRDVLKAEHSSTLELDVQSHESHDSQTLLSDFMKDEVVTISKKTPLLDAALYMQRHRLGCLPVVEEEDDRLIGIVTDSDFINVAINLLELAKEQELATDG